MIILTKSEIQKTRAVGLELVTWDSSQLESVILRLETWLETWAFGLETWLVTWRLGLGLDSRLAANDLDHKSESQVARKTESLYNFSFDILIKYNASGCFQVWCLHRKRLSKLFPLVSRVLSVPYVLARAIYVHAICSYRISRVQYNIETEKYIQDAII